MARLFDDASGDQLESASAIVTGSPFTVTIHGRSDDGIDNFQMLFGITDKGVASNHYRMRLRITTPKIEWDAEDAGGESSADTTVGPSANTWFHVAAVEAAADDRRVFLDGANKATNAVSRSPASLDTTSIGVLDDGSPSDRFSGDLGHAALWDAALIDQNIATVANGWSPRQVVIDNLIGYWPINGQSPEPNIVGTGTNMTVTGTSVSEEPPIPHFLVAA